MVELTEELLTKIDNLADKLKKENLPGYTIYTTCPACGGRMNGYISPHNKHLSLVCKNDNCIKMRE